MPAEGTIAQRRNASASVKSGIPRSVDALLAVTGLIAASPVLLVAGIAIALTSPGPVMFRQERVGLNGHRFLLYKLRSMSMSNEGPQVTAQGDPRVTPVGRVLRKWKLDELPELWNVLKGDMSLVGPRPEVPHYVDLDNPMWKEVLKVRPGLTDPVTLHLREEEIILAQVEGDRDSYYREVLQPYKLSGNLEYLQSRSWCSDLKILWKTGIAVVFPSLQDPPAFVK